MGRQTWPWIIDLTSSEQNLLSNIVAAVLNEVETGWAPPSYNDGAAAIYTRAASDNIKLYNNCRNVSATALKNEIRKRERSSPALLVNTIYNYI